MSEHVQTAMAPVATRDALSWAADMYMHCRSDWGLMLAGTMAQRQPGKTTCCSIRGSP